jgi:hypothetical protein
MYAVRVEKKRKGAKGVSVVIVAHSHAYFKGINVNSYNVITGFSRSCRIFIGCGVL